MRLKNEPTEFSKRSSQELKSICHKTLLLAGQNTAFCQNPQKHNKESTASLYCITLFGCAEGARARNGRCFFFSLQYAGPYRAPPLPRYKPALLNHNKKGRTIIISVWQREMECPQALTLKMYAVWRNVHTKCEQYTKDIWWRHHVALHSPPRHPWYE